MPSTATEPLIRTRQLTKRYGTFTAVDRLNLEVRRGEIFGLLGPNGAGKTTTVLMLLGLTEPSGGSATIVGLDPQRNPLEIKRHVGYLPDNVGFYDGMTGRENLRFTARLNRLDPRAAEDRIAELLGRVGLSDAADKRVETYSRGMLQRLGIADTLVKDPQIVILDEPTIGIDPAGIVEVVALVRSLAVERGTTVLLSSHQLHQVQRICDRVGIFVSGRLVAQGRMAELADRLGGGPVTIEVGLDGSASAVERALRSVPGVQQVQRDDREPSVWLVTSERDVRERLVRDLVGAGLAVLHVRRRGDELDDIYQRYFAREEARSGAA